MLSPEKMAKLKILDSLLFPPRQELDDEEIGNLNIGDQNSYSNILTENVVENSEDLMNNNILMKESDDEHNISMENSDEKYGEIYDYEDDDDSDDDSNYYELGLDDECCGGWPAEIKEEDLEKPQYMMAAKYALEELESKTNLKFKLEKIISGTWIRVSGYDIKLNLKVKDERGNYYVYQANIYTCLSRDPNECMLDLTGELINDVGGATVMNF
ncbi:hypothetical protein ACHQM5_000635 [Ranunculus cassubicifolius]